MILGGRGERIDEENSNDRNSRMCLDFIRLMSQMIYPYISSQKVSIFKVIQTILSDFKSF